MYNSIPEVISLDKKTRDQRTDVINRLYGMEFNLIPMNGKRPCFKWKIYQSERVTPEEIKEWMSGQFPTKDGTNIWKPEVFNFALLTGAVPWSDDNPGTVVLDADDEEAEELVLTRCPPTPMVQITGSGYKQFVYQRPSIQSEHYIGNRQKVSFNGVRYNLDIRGDGGYIMAPGSIHPESKKLYEEETPWTLELMMECPVYDPAWLPSEAKGRSRSTALVPADISSEEHTDVIAENEMSVEERETQARRYLDSVPGTQEGTGANNKCTVLTMKLLWGFALPASVVQDMLNEWGQKTDQLSVAGGWYPWLEDELSRKIEWCLGQKYRGEVGDRLAPYRDLGDLESQVDEIVTPVDDAHTIDPKNHLAIAETFLRDCFARDRQPTLIHQQSTWHQWTGTRYEVVSDDDIKARLWKWLATCRIWDKEKRTPFRPSRNVVSSAMDALKAVANESSQLEAPCWLTQGPSEIIAFENGLLDVGEFVSSGQKALSAHTPNWFSPNCLPHSFSATESCPQWLEFLNDVFDGDEERITALQQWFGYNLINDNRQHKIAMLIGPPRSGKGTTMAVMSAMLGRHNVASTSLASLGGRFGLEPLVGKMAALIDEGHLGKFSDSSLVLERLKAISGGSEQTVDRKGVAAMSSVALKIRFTLAVNELPRLSDSSAALRARLLVIPYFNTYEGKEDFGLVDRLLIEVSGITNWALEGLRQLKTIGRFQNPSVSEKIMRDFVYLSSPVKAFIDECCEVGAEKFIRRNDLQLAWKVWCDENGHVHGSDNDFGKKLRAVVSRIDDERKCIGGKRERWYLGVGLTEETAADMQSRLMTS